MEIHEYFTKIDWLVVFGYLALTTLVGHLMRGKQATIKDFFLGGRSLPWYAVCGSIIATEISGVTFIGVPGMVYALEGNFMYLQWAIGSIFARILVGMFFVKVFYEQEIFSPYDYMGNRLGLGVKQLATVIFSIGSILGQSVRVLVAALALRVVTGMDFHLCIWIIGLFAICWTLMGGMQTVIWTDVMQFGLFVIGGLTALFWIVGGIDGGWGTFMDVAKNVPEAGASGKFTLLNLTRDPAAGFTIWVAILAVPFLNLSAFGVDQLNAQRMFCCRSAADAKKAIIFSSVGQLITLMMLMVGAALFVYYKTHGLSAAEEALFAQDHDYVFPTWITTQLPIGLRGLIMAGIFAAAISSLDSILAALSQTTLSIIHHGKPSETEADQKRLMQWSRGLVIGWGVFLSAFAIGLNELRGSINMVQLAFGMVSYTMGPILALFIAALLKDKRHASTLGLVLGFFLSVILVLYVRTDLYQILINFKVMTADQAASLGAIKITETGGIASKLFYGWMWPVTFFVTLACGMLIPKTSRD